MADFLFCFFLRGILRSAKRNDSNYPQFDENQFPGVTELVSDLFHYRQSRWTQYFWLMTLLVCNFGK